MSSNATTPACSGADCFFSSSGRPPYIFFGVSALFAVAVVLLQTGVIVFHIRGAGMSRPQVLATFVLLWSSVVLRAVWFMLRACDRDGVAEHFVNRFSVMLFFSGFSLYLQTWVRFVGVTSGRLGGGHSSDLAATLSRTCDFVGGPASCFSSSKAWLWNLVLNVSNWVVIFSLSFASQFGDCKPCQNWGYIVLSIECFLLSVGFLQFGSRMYARLRNPGRRNPRIQTIARKVLIVLSVCCACFAVRSVFWLWEPVSGNYSPEGTYPFLHYTVTGLVPSVVLFAVMAPAGRSPSQRTGMSSLSNRGQKQSSVEKDQSSKSAETMEEEGVVDDDAVSVEISHSSD